MTSPIDKLYQAICGGRQSLTKILQQTQVIAAKLNLEDVENWVALELNGYPDENQLPTYRKVFPERLEVYNAHRDTWLPAGQLNYGLEARESIEVIEGFAQKDSVFVPVLKNFTLKNDFGDSFGSDWPQRFAIKNSQYKSILQAVTNRWAAEFKIRGLQLFDLQKFTIFLAHASKKLQAR